MLKSRHFEDQSLGDVVSFGRRPRINELTGTAGDDRLVASRGVDHIDLSQGGHDFAAARNGDDIFFLGAAFDEGDRLKGGEGHDALILSGNYSAGLRIFGRMLQGCETIALQGDYDYDLTLAPDVQPSTYYTFNIAAHVAGSVRIDAHESALGIGYHGDATHLTVLAGSGRDYLDVTPGSTTIFDGGDGFDSISLYAVSEAGIVFDLASTVPQHVGSVTVTVHDVEDVSGTDGDDLIRGDAQGNFISGGEAGNDMLFGHGGDDFLSMGAGTYQSALPTHGQVNGGAGFDVLDIATAGPDRGGVTVSLADHDFQDTGQGVFKIKAVEALSGTSADDVLSGDDGANALLGGFGDDVLSGAAGDDVLYGDGGPQFGTAANDGSRFSIYDIQVAGSDTLDGGAGNDRIVGGWGADVLTGGADDDVFAYLHLQDSKSAKADLITDFTFGDRIDVSAIDADSATVGDQAFHFGATEGHSGDIVVRYETASDTTIISLFTNADATADMTIDLAGNVALTAADFVL